ncbi:aldo/keto reductase [Methylocapsa palsarum]|uniref:Predicted oxidoreductase n=1 Tax=Methylocapsa palsarum TaxID=1612308 RepID=A0A1I4B3C0_9HYPH|nr:aldo/keto reductase [Methylocapsa palsarum]SFK62376.1 Predicted oxidoreductase [Methylocapsa palsarum]
MRNVFCPGLGRDVSALGFGCAALGSRVSETQGRRALDRAFEQGVTWYDVAPFYGDGEAEAIFGRFLSGRRDKVVVCAQLGSPRAPPSFALRFFTRLRHFFVRTFPELGDVRVTPSRRRKALSAGDIEGLIVESLRRLKSDYIDVVALHDPGPPECADQDVLGALQNLVERGYARRLAVSGSVSAVNSALDASSLFQITQFVDNPFDPDARRLRDELWAADRFFVTQGVFSSGAYERVSRLLAGDGGRLASLASQLGYGPPFIASDMLLDYAFATNPAGVVLAAMFNPSHIAQNCARASRPPRADIAPFIEKFFVNA